ncbi:MAG TPA: hypothetical protein VFV19_13705 [Candidatus Polarisedimenticolaceae bacterium]|nr:hypothetical protein [Candidatus Polarisedimenticolaceae bacterium]
MFAPVYFPPSAYIRVGFSYAPTIAIDLGLMIGHLFACPRYTHYYFGDYYDEAYVRAGIFPRFDGDRVHTWYDPDYQRDRSRYSRTDPHWEEHQRQEYARRQNDASLRPVRTYRELQARSEAVPEAQRRSVALAGPVRVIAARQASPLSFKQVNPAQRQQIAASGSQVHRFHDDRANWEAPGGVRATAPPMGESRGRATRESGSAGSAPRSSTESSAAVAHPTEEQTHAPRGEARSQTGGLAQAPRFVAPHPVSLTKPERVTIPTPPVVAKAVERSNDGQRVPPPPVSERKHQVQQSKGDKKEQPKQDK